MPSMSRAPDRVSLPDVLILCPEKFDRDIRTELARQSDVNWEKQRFIRVCNVAHLDLARTVQQTEEIKQCCGQRENLLHVIAFEQVGIEPSRLDNVLGQIAWTHRPGSVAGFRRILPRLLRSLSLDLIGITLRTVSGAWEHGTVDRERIEEWVSQFQKLGGAEGDYTWLGQRLLSALDFWPASRVMDALDMTPQGVQGFDAICVNAERLGKSASNLANKIRKRLDSLGTPLPVEDLHRALEHGKRRHILFVEDCMMTGNEMTRVIGGLLGEPDPFGTPRAGALPDPSLLRSVSIRIRCAVAANGGYATIRRFLQSRNLSNVEIDTPTNGLLEVYSQDGLRAIDNETECDEDDCLREPDRYIMPHVFRKYELWGDTPRSDRAIALCREIGRQLYKGYLIGRGKTRPDRWLDEAALGVRSFGLALAFAHSVPKETLPLFWTPGRIEHGGKKMDWTPLFPAAL